MKLSEYNKAECIFIDANIFLDYSLPNPKYGESAADFLEKIELNIATRDGDFERIEGITVWEP